MGCSFCLPRRRDEPAPVEADKSRRTSTSEQNSGSVANNATNTKGEVQAKRATQHPDPRLVGTSRRQNDSVAVNCGPARRCGETAPGKPAESGGGPAYGTKSDYVAQNGTNSNEEIPDPEVQAKPVAKQSHPHRDGKPRRPHDNEAARIVTKPDGELATARENMPKPTENHAHPHHYRQQNDNVVEKYRLRRHHRGYGKRRPADDTIYEVTGLRMPETDFSEDVPCRLKAASNETHSAEVAIPPQHKITANVDPRGSAE